MPTETMPQTDADKRESVIFSLEPFSSPRKAEVIHKTEKPDEKVKIEIEIAPISPMKPMKEKKEKPIKAAKVKIPKVNEERQSTKITENAEVVKGTQAQYLELGENYRIAHKPGSAYSVLYKVVAESGHFSAMVKALSEEPDMSDITTAKKILSKMLVPVDELESMCRSESGWQDHADRKTTLLKERAEGGDTQADGVLKNGTRASRGTWKGNIPEMISTCVGSYAAFCSGKAGNKNVQKFAEAKLLFRRFRSTDGKYVMMYPEQFESAIELAIKTVYGSKEES